MLAIYARTSKDTKNLTIEQQKVLGVKYAISNNFEYKIYEDAGKSGYKIDDDDMNPFANRPAFSNLINDVKTGIIDKLWVYDHARISRNQYASAVIFRILLKHNIEIIIKNKTIDLKDPHLRFMLHVMEGVTELERFFIVDRTTRGLHQAINKGNRGYPKLFGYKKCGKDDNGRMIWQPVESEINDLKYIYEQYLGGKSLRNIAHELYDEINSHNKLLRYATKMSRFIKHYEYTGFALNMEGLDIFHKFYNLEIDNISVLLDKKYWVKSTRYPIEIISIENWIKVIERLHLNKVAKREQTVKSRSTKKDLATGIITCSVCNAKYFSYLTPYKRPNGEYYHYNYYKHHMALNNKVCSHRPKTIKVEKADEIFKTFYFFYYIVFSQANIFVKETLEKIRHDIQTMETKINSEEQSINKIKKQIAKLDDLLGGVSDINALTVTANKIAKLEEELSEKINILPNMKIELENQRSKYSKTELENTYLNIKERIINFFKEMNTEDRRNELLRIIKKCILFGNYLIIDTGDKVFLFDIDINNTFDESLLDDLDKDRIYKDYFLRNPSFKAPKKLLNGRPLIDINFNANKRLEEAGIPPLRKLVKDFLTKRLKINYDISTHTNIIYFIDLEIDYTNFGKEISLKKNK
jgi:DNA invertase Pin-like site-specific DNA recombinase/cell division protein FtsL